MNNKGFTLVEIIAVIALIAVVMVIITPNIMEILTNSADKAMKVQESEVNEAGLLYLEDHCKNPIEDKRCDLENMQINSLDYTYNGYIDLQKLINEKYIEPVEISGVECTGYVRIYDNKSEACLVCGDKYATRNDKACTRGLR